MMVAATFALTNCTVKENFGSEMPEEILGQEFSIIANTFDTKTVNDGLNTNWSANDSIAVFHAEAESTTYTKDSKFLISEENLAANKFTGTLSGSLDSEKSYDWYMIYPYNKDLKSPANTGNGFNAIGCKSNAVQTQTGNDSMSHLCGANLPLIGKATAVAAGEVPQVTFKNVASVIAVEVSNGLTRDLIVKNVAIQAEENLVGQYFIDFAGEEVSFTNNKNYQAKFARLTVNNGEAITSGSKAKFYIAVKPFTCTEASTLEVTVNNVTKTIAIPAGTQFSSGKIKTVRFAMDKEFSAYDWEKVTAADELAAGDVIVVANSAAQKAIGTTQNSYNRGDATVVVDGDYLTPSDTTEIITLVTGKETGTFGFRTSTFGYLSAISSSSNNMKTLDTLGANGSFKVTYAAGKATVKTVGSYTRNMLQYNGNYNIFSLYGSAQTNGDVDIYKRIAKLSPMGDLTVTGSLSGNVASISWNALSAAKDYTISSPLGTETVTGTSADVTLPWNGDYTITVTANPTDDTQYKSTTDSISFTVGKDPAATVKTIADLNAILSGFTATGNFSADLIGTSYEGYIAGNNIGKNLSNLIAVVDKDATESKHGAIVYGFYLDPATYAVGKKVTITIRDSSSVSVYNGLPEAKAVQVTLDDAAAVEMAAVELPAASVTKDYAGMYVKVAGLKYTSGWSTWNGTKSFTDGTSSVDIRTNTTADWASDYINPETESGSISGIVTIYNTAAQIQPLRTDDFEDFEFLGKAIVSTSPTALSWEASSTAAKTLNATVLNCNAADIALSSLTNFTAVVTSVADKKAVITVTPKAANTSSAKIQENLTVTVGSYSKTVALSQAKPGVENKVLSFSFTSAPTGWKTSKATAAAGNYTYTLDSVDYTFNLSKAADGIYIGASYLMVCKNETVGLPAIEGYVLTKIVVTNSSGCSKYATVSVLKGTDTVADAQTWATASTAYTYDIANGAANTSYSLAVSSAANCQMVNIQLTYAPVD